MTPDALQPLNPALEASPQRPLWPALTRWWSPTTDAPDPVLGYESAHPWALHADAPAEGRIDAY